MRKIGFIGAGNMAGAIIAGMLGSGSWSPADIGVYDVSPEQQARYREAGHPVHGSVGELVAAAGIVVLSVKPQIFPAVLPEVKAALTPDKLVVSIAAGMGADYIQGAVGFPCKLVLVMPNTPLMVGHGAAALARVEPTTAEEFEEVRRIFALSGIAEEVPPDKMNAVSSVHGTMPAQLYLLAKTVVDCAVAEGIDREVAHRLFCQTLIGAAEMMKGTGRPYQELIDMVCSPGGTTLAGLAALEEKGFVPALQAAFAASIRRAEELSK